MGERHGAVQGRPGPREPSRVRWGCIVAVVAAPLVVGGGLGLAAWLLMPQWMRPDTRFRGPPTEPVAMRLAPPEPSSEVPLGGGEGHDRYGYPLKSADAVAMRSLLLASRFGELQRHIERFQTEAEADFRREYWIADVREVFSTADAQVGRRIEAWRQRSPTSFAPYLAMGDHLASVASHQRGGAVVAETSGERLDAMHRTAVLAMAAYHRAIELRPRLFTADLGLIGLASFVGDHATKDAAYAHALAACPACMSPRKVYMYFSRPRWGGSLTEMATIGEDANQRAGENPRLATLRGFVDWEAGETFRERQQWALAIAAYDRAIAVGELEDFYVSRGSTRVRAGDTNGALADYESARALRPARTAEGDEILTYLRARRGETAVGAFVRALLLDPTDTFLHYRMTDASKAAAYVGWQHARAERSTEALAWLDLARQIDPANGDAHHRFVYTGRRHGERLATELAAVEARARAQPDSFEAVRDLDYALATSRGADAYTRIAALWDAYIARHPRDARAFVERSGTLMNMGNRQGGIRDAVVACHLGNRVGCLQADQIRGIAAAYD